MVGCRARRACASRAARSGARTLSDSLHQQRLDLACALRWAARLGLHEGASALVPCDAAGNVLEGQTTVEPTAFFIHSRIHPRAPQAVCVLHTHMPYATALTLRRDGRLAMSEQNALILYGCIAYGDAYGGLALDGSEGDRIAASLGNASALMLASHGVIVTGRTVTQAFTDLYYLERAAPAQVLAASGGHAPRTIPEDVQRRAAQQHMQEYEGLSERLFCAYRRMLDKEEPDYRV